MMTSVEPQNLANWWELIKNVINYEKNTLTTATVTALTVMF